jgi:hypothetical protein
MQCEIVFTAWLFDSSIPSYSIQISNAMQCNAICIAIQSFFTAKEFRSAMQCEIVFTAWLFDSSIPSYSIQISNAMQCNAMECNAMQWNAMECNGMHCNPILFHSK